MQFADNLEQIARQTGCTVIAESYPLSPAVPDAAEQDRELEELAQTFDYSCAVEGKIVTLRKQFSRAEDLPDLTLGECERFIEGLHGIVASFHTRGGPFEQSAHLLWELYYSFSASQRRELQGREQNVSGLSDSQKSLLWRLLLTNLIDQPLATSDWAASDLREIMTRPGRFCWNEMLGTRRYGYEIARESGIPLHIALEKSKPPVASSGGAGAFMVTRSLRAPLLTAEDTLWSETGSDNLPPLPTGALCLQELSRYFPSCTVDRRLHGKTVSIFGEANVAPEQVLDAVVNLYALEKRVLEDGTTLLTTRSAQPVSSVEKIPTALKQSVPVSLLRYIERRNREPEAVPAEPDLPPHIREVLRLHAPQQIPLFSPHALHYLLQEAIRRLYRVADPEAPERREASGEVTLPTAEVQSLLGLVSLTHFLPRINPLTLPVSEVLTNFEAATLGCNIILRGGGEMLYMDLKAPRGDGIFASMGIAVPFP